MAEQTNQHADNPEHEGSVPLSQPQDNGLHEGTIHSADAGVVHHKGLFEDTNFWFTIAFVLFIALLIKVGAFSKITSGLDNRSKRISRDLGEARRLRAEAEELKASYERKLADAEKDAQAIVEAAEKNAALLEKQAQEDLKAYTARKKAALAQRVEIAEKNLLDDLKADVAARSLHVVEQVLGQAYSGQAGSEAIKSGLADLKKTLN